MTNIRWPELPSIPYHSGPSKIPSFSRCIGGRVQASKFRREWFKEHPWLHYSDDLKAVICFKFYTLCRIHGATNFSSQAMPAFLWKGYSVWNCASRRFRAHAKESSSLAQALKMRSADVPELGKWLKKKT